MTATRWWVLQASATLQTVATQNYACFGRGGVPRHDRPPAAASASAPAVAPDSATLCVELIIRAPEKSDQPESPESGSAIRLANLDMTLAAQEITDQRIIWSGYDAAQHLQTIWVWDFFRLLSHVVLRVADTQTEVAAASGKTSESGTSAWQTALNGLRAAAAGDVMMLNVRSACGDIHQQHILTGPAILWEPAQLTQSQGDTRHGQD